MTLHDLAALLRGHRPIAVYRRRAGGRELLVAGRLEGQEHGLLLVADTDGALHRIHLHADLIIERGESRALDRQ